MHCECHSSRVGNLACRPSLTSQIRKLSLIANHFSFLSSHLLKDIPKYPDPVSGMAALAVHNMVIH
jgi:hypothetical protein